MVHLRNSVMIGTTTSVLWDATVGGGCVPMFTDIHQCVPMCTDVLENLVASMISVSLSLLINHLL